MSHHWILENITRHGHKSTTTRRLIAEFLTRHKGLFCARTIEQALPSLDKVSIYRTLELMKSLDIITAVTTIDGQQFYEVNKETDHHHHIICTDCKKTKCVDCQEHAATPNIPGFSKIKHSIILTGVCDTCNDST